jgi:uncharacterized membrane protein YgdD (TMEM256/DUF423 family)
MNPDRLFAFSGAVSGLLSVALGAFGAHGLRQRLAPEMLAVFETGVRYQVYHALGLFAVAWAISRWAGTGGEGGPQMAWAGWLFIAGTVIFCGSLYAMALTGARWLGAITPLGGICFIAGWACLAWGLVAAR